MTAQPCGYGLQWPRQLFELEGQDVTASLPDGLSDPGTDGLSRLSAPILSFPEDTTNIQGTGVTSPPPIADGRDIVKPVSCFVTAPVLVDWRWTR